MAATDLLWRCVSTDGNSGTYVLATRAGHERRGYLARLPDGRRAQIHHDSRGYEIVIYRARPAWDVLHRVQKSSLGAAKKAAGKLIAITDTLPGPSPRSILSLKTIDQTPSLTGELPLVGAFDEPSPRETT